MPTSSGAIFNEAKLNNANFERADLSATNIQDALTLENANLHGVKGLTREQLEACKLKGAIVDEDSPASAPQPVATPLTSTES